MSRAKRAALPPTKIRATAAARVGVTLTEYDLRVAAGMKWCVGCKLWHRRIQFGSDKSRSDGLASTCREFRLSASSRPGTRARRTHAAVGLAWCRSCCRWLPQGEVTQGACRTHINAADRVRYVRTAPSVRARKSARVRGLAPIPPWWRDERFAEFGGLCAYGCRRPARTLDHVWPVVRGGESRPSNLVPACVHCNSSKKDSDHWPWLDRLNAAFPSEFLDFMDLNQIHGGPFDPDAEVAA